MTPEKVYGKLLPGVNEFLYPNPDSAYEAQQWVEWRVMDLYRPAVCRVGAMARMGKPWMSCVLGFRTGKVRVSGDDIEEVMEKVGQAVEAESDYIET